MPQAINACEQNITNIIIDKNIELIKIFLKYHK